VDVQMGNLPDDRIGVTLGHSIYLDSDAAGRGWYTGAASPDGREFARMDLLTTVMHEMGNAMGFPETNGHGVMSDTLYPGVRLPINALDFDANPGAPTSDATLMRAARTAVELKFELDAFSNAAAGVSAGTVDWQAPSSEGWNAGYSPFNTTKMKSAAANFSDYFMKLAGKGGSAADSSTGYDSLGKSVGSKSGKGVGGR
jgi:hypothetical protein